ncbi:MAG TPA: glycosyltransferase family 39 protein [bacterium]|nr:glycosyltransferase family 39 protein [bacterium]
MDVMAASTGWARSPGWRAFLLWTILIAAVGTALSLLAAAYTRPPGLLLDENYYYPLAEGLAKGIYQDGYIIRPPLYPLFLAAVFKVFGTGFRPALVISSLLRGLLIAGIAGLGSRYVSRRAGLIGALLVTIYPMLVFTYTRFLTEIVYIPLFVLSFWTIERAAQSLSARDSLLAGLVAGISALARSTSLFFTIVVACWFAAKQSPAGRFSRRNLIAAAILAGGMLAAISPWTARNAVVHKALILVDNSSAYNLWLITSGKPVKDATQEWESWGSQAERQHEGYARWLESLRKDPAFHFKRMGIVIPKLFDPRSQPDTYSLSMVRRGDTVVEKRALKDILEVLIPVLFWLVSLGGLAGLILMEHNAIRRNLVLITVIYFIGLHAMTLARPRFLLPMEMVLAIYAGALIDGGLSRLGLTRQGRPWRWSPASRSRSANPEPPLPSG